MFVFTFVKVSPPPPNGELYADVLEVTSPRFHSASSSSIVRTVKRDWAVLSKDTPMDISILKSVRQSVFIHLRNALHLYTCIYL